MFGFFIFMFTNRSTKNDCFSCVCVCDIVQKDAEKSGRDRESQWLAALTVSALECWSDVKRRLDDRENDEYKVWELQPLLGLLFHGATLVNKTFLVMSILTGVHAVTSSSTSLESITILSRFVLYHLNPK